MRKILRLLVHAAPLVLLALPGADGARGATDWLQYIASHPDLIRALGVDETAGERHYLQSGQAEGRVLDAFAPVREDYK